MLAGGPADDETSFVVHRGRAFGAVDRVPRVVPLHAITGGRVVALDPAFARKVSLRDAERPALCRIPPHGRRQPEPRGWEP